MAKKKPQLSFWQIWNMSFGFLGIQFGFALQNANTSRIFQTLGADVGNLAIYWIAAPLTGLIVQPIIGYYSDRTWHPRWGRRRPFFLIGAILASIALVFMPNSPTLWIAIGMLWIMDASINVSMEPFRAFVGDNLPDEQRTSGFAMQSFFIGVGAVVASMLPWMLTNWFNVDNTASEGMIGDSVKWSFYLGAIVFFLAVLWTVLKSHEYSPEELAEYTGEEDAFKEEEFSVEEYTQGGKRQMNIGMGFLAIGAAFTGLVYYFQEHLEKELFLLGAMIAVIGLFWLVSGSMKKGGNYNNGFVGIMSGFLEMPKTMKQLAWVQFFSWFALFAMWIYTTAGVTSHIYGTSDTTSALYNEGADWVGILFAVYNGVAALVAFSLPVLAKYTNRKITHMICLFLGGIGLISVYFIGDPKLLWVPMIGVGFAWASILSMPYAMLSGALPAGRMLCRLGT